MTVSSPQLHRRLPANPSSDVGSLPLASAYGTGNGVVEVIFYRSEYDSVTETHEHSHTTIFDSAQSRSAVRRQEAGGLPLTHRIG